MALKFAFILIALVLIVLNVSNNALEIKQSAHFLEKEVNTQHYTIFLKRLSSFNSNFGRVGVNPEMQCASVCLNDENCSCFYTEDGACVFGLTSYAESFEGEVVTPAENQIVKRKRE